MSLAYIEQRKANDLQQSRHTREICWLIYRANADPKTAARTREEFMPLDGDAKPVAKKLSKAQQKKIAETAARINAQLNKR